TAEVSSRTRVIGVPKTIDNDLEGTDHCPGYGSAARYAAITIRELGLDVRSLPIHVVIVELMGRNAGWITAASALARTPRLAAPHLIYLPETPFDAGQFVSDVRRAQKSFGTGIVVAVSEGLADANGNPVSESGIVDGFGHRVPGGVAQHLAAILMREGIKAQGMKPGLIGRTSSRMASEVDRKEALEVGRRAFLGAYAGKTGCMIGIRRSEVLPYEVDYPLVPLSEVANRERRVPREMVDAQRANVTDLFVQYALPLIGGCVPEGLIIPYDK
ncbi:MAG TPA: diphosphate--fructose-6-phosphate 1-phosphotransferase, partial [Spirochaetia bacterium]|nr:diphosphate--fructose-6-phosphate 1-phosphotransferase [Spirochaetia bacterium]